MNVRFLFAIWIAVAMAFAPFAMPMGEAMAAPAGHHAAMATANDTGHCNEQKTPGHSDQDKDKPCCVAGCMTAATLPAVSSEAAAIPRMSERPGIDRFHRGYLGEIATPPPRLS